MIDTDCFLMISGQEQLNSYDSAKFIIAGLVVPVNRTVGYKS